MYFFDSAICNYLLLWTKRFHYPTGYPNSLVYSFSHCWDGGAYAVDETTSKLSFLAVGYNNECFSPWECEDVGWAWSSPLSVSQLSFWIIQGRPSTQLLANYSMKCSPR